MIATYYGFILLVALAPHVLAAPLYRGATTTVGIAAGVAIILVAIGLTACYVLRANRASVWGDVLHHARAPVFLDNPALVSVPLAFVGIVAGSLADRGERARRERDAFARQECYAQTGVLASRAVQH